MELPAERYWCLGLITISAGQAGQLFCPSGETGGHQQILPAGGQSDSSLNRCEQSKNAKGLPQQA